MRGLRGERVGIERRGRGDSEVVSSLPLQGTPPLSMEKVKDAEIRKMIDLCTCVDKGRR